MQTNIELASASGRAIRLPVTARRERRSAVVERPQRPVALFTLVKEAKRSERWENLVWIGIAIAAVVLLIMSFVISVGRASSRAAETGKPITLERLAVLPAPGKTLAPPLRKKLVADAVYSQEMFRSVPVITEFFSQLDDDLVESAGGAKVIVTPYVVEQTVAREDFTGMTSEDLKQLKLFSREFLDRFAATKLESFCIDGCGADMKDVLPVQFGGGSCDGATKECVDSCKELADSEGLGDVVVSAEIQSDDFVDFLTFGSQHQNGRRIVFGAELFAYFIPARAGKHDVKDDEGRMAFGYSIDGFIATVTDGHDKTVPFHDFFQSEQDMRIIFDDENSRFHGVAHADFLSQAGHNGSRSVKQLPPPSRGS